MAWSGCRTLEEGRKLVRSVMSDQFGGLLIRFPVSCRESQTCLVTGDSTGSSFFLFFSSFFGILATSLLTSLAGSLTSEGDIVLVTATTRGLGSYLLAELALDPRVSRVYVVNRPSVGSGSIITEAEICSHRQRARPRRSEFA